MVHWPDNPPVRIERALSIEHGDAANVSEISMGAHTGTHMDGPIHFVREGKGLDEMPFAATIGRARVIEIQDPESIKPEELDPHATGIGMDLGILSPAVGAAMVVAGLLSVVLFPLSALTILRGKPVAPDDSDGLEHAGREPEAT